MWQECIACAAATAPRPEFVAMADDDARNATFTKAEIPLSSPPASLHLSLDLLLVQVGYILANSTNAKGQLTQISCEQAA